MTVPCNYNLDETLATAKSITTQKMHKQAIFEKDESSLRNSQNDIAILGRPINYNYLSHSPLFYTKHPIFIICHDCKFNLFSRLNHILVGIFKISNWLGGQNPPDET